MLSLMNKLSNNEVGFGAIEVVLTIVVIFVAGISVWLVYKNHHEKIVPTAVAETTKKTTEAPNQYAGWRTFCSSVGGLCLKYPATWKFSQKTQYYEIDTMTSPTGKVMVDYSPTDAPGGCTGSNATIHVANVLFTEAKKFDIINLAKLQKGSSSATYYSVHCVN